MREPRSCSCSAPWLNAKIRELGTDDPAVLAPLFGVSEEAMAIRIEECQRRGLLTVIEGGGETTPALDPRLALASVSQSTSRYEYSAHDWAEIERAARRAFPTGTRLHRVSLEADFGGVDAVYRIDHRCDLQIRVRRDRPAYAADEDIAFRKTEPAMIAAGTYAPLAFFLWMKDGFVEAGKIVDVYAYGRGDRPTARRARTRRQAPTGHSTSSRSPSSTPAAPCSCWAAATRGRRHDSVASAILLRPPPARAAPSLGRGRGRG